MTENQIEGITAVFEAVGFETSFHDGEVLNITLDRAQGIPSLTVSILTRQSLWLTEGDPDRPLYYVVRIVFSDIDKLDLENFNQQNVIQNMVITGHDGPLKVWIAGLFGVECSFTCARARVLSVEGTTMQWGMPSGQGQDITERPSRSGES